MGLHGQRRFARTCAPPVLGNIKLPELPALVLELTCGDEARAEAAAQQISALNGDAVPTLNALLASPDSDVRWWATRTLGAIRHRSVTPSLLRALRDEEEAVCLCAAVGLREQPDPTAIPALVSLLGNKRILLARLAADALIAIGRPATPALVAVIENGTHAERLGAVRALSFIGDPRAIPALYKALDTDSVLIQHWADKGLDDLGVGIDYFTPD